MAKRPRSACWDYFQKQDELAICLVGQCKWKIKHCGNTSNLLKHLNASHPEQHQLCLAAQNANKAAKRTPTTAGPSALQQLTLSEATSMTRVYPKDSSKCKKLDNSLIEMIATDIQPISVVEDKGFINFTSALDPWYKLPSRRTITRRLLPAKYEEKRESLFKVLRSNVKMLCLPQIFGAQDRDGRTAVWQRMQLWIGS